MDNDDYTLKETYVILNDLSNKSFNKSVISISTSSKINFNKQKNYKIISTLFREIIRRGGQFYSSKNIFRIPTSDLTNKEIIERLKAGKKIDNFNNFQIASALKYVIREIYDGISNLYLLRLLYTCEIEKLKKVNLYSIFYNICTPFDKEIFENLCNLFSNLNLFKSANNLSTEAICIIFTPVFIGNYTMTQLNFDELKKYIEIFKLIISKKI